MYEVISNKTKSRKEFFEDIIAFLNLNGYNKIRYYCRRYTDCYKSFLQAIEDDNTYCAVEFNHDDICLCLYSIHDECDLERIINEYRYIEPPLWKKEQMRKEGYEFDDYFIVCKTNQEAYDLFVKIYFDNYA